MSTTAVPAVATPVLNTSGHVNASGYLTDEDHEDIGFTELQTVGIACVATLIPLGIALFAVFGIRMVWKNWRADSDERSLRRTDSSDPNKSSHLLLPDEIKTSESQFSVIPVEELDEVLTTYNTTPSTTNNLNHTRKSTANGSIITMTMKNNHLIVETEERILGVSEIPCLPSPLEKLSGEEDRTALVHQSEDEAAQDGPKTGLSQSDLSVSSSGSANPSYCYGNQMEYLGDDQDQISEIHTTTNVRLKHFPFMVQPSHDIEDDELYLEQQHQLGNGLDDVQTVPDIFPQYCNPYENPGFVATPEQAQVNPIS